MQAGEGAVQIEGLGIAAIFAGKLPRRLAAGIADLHHRRKRGLLEPANVQLFVGRAVTVAAGVGAKKRKARSAQVDALNHGRRQSTDAQHGLRAIFDRLAVAGKRRIHVARPDDRHVLLIAPAPRATQQEAAGLGQKLRVGLVILQLVLIVSGALVAAIA